MIHTDSLSQVWIDSVASKLGKIDRALLEKCIRALFLTEQLTIKGLQFQFKGGTSLLFHFAKPRRFSIDVDIVCSDKSHEIIRILDGLITDNLFSRWEEDLRPHSVQGLPIQHFKCYYDSHYPGLSKSNYILLDVMYRDSLPNWTEFKIIEHTWLKTFSIDIEVVISTKEGLLGDKLTAFAPMTTGILYSKNRPLEIIKQLYDIGALFDVVHDLVEVKRVFKSVVIQEIVYRNLSIDPEEVLDDAFQAALTICDRNENEQNFQHLKIGITNIRPHIFQRFTADDAIVAAAKLIYLITLLRQEKIPTINRFVKAQDVSEWNIIPPANNRFNKLKKANPEAFFYIYQAQILW